VCCTRLAGNAGRKMSPKIRRLGTIKVHRTTLSACVFAIKACIDNGKSFLNSNTFSTCPHNMVNFGPLAAEIGWRVWGTPANFNGLRMLASLLRRRRSTEANQTLCDVWPSPALILYIYIFGGSCPLTEFWQVHCSLWHTSIQPFDHNRHGPKIGGCAPFEGGWISI